MEDQLTYARPNQCEGYQNVKDMWMSSPGHAHFHFYNLVVDMITVIVKLANISWMPWKLPIDWQWSYMTQNSIMVWMQNILKPQLNVVWGHWELCSECFNLHTLATHYSIDDYWYHVWTLHVLRYIKGNFNSRHFRSSDGLGNCLIWVVAVNHRDCIFKFRTKSRDVN